MPCFVSWFAAEFSRAQFEERNYSAFFFAPSKYRSVTRIKTLVPRIEAMTRHISKHSPNACTSRKDKSIIWNERGRCAGNDCSRENVRSNSLHARRRSEKKGSNLRIKAQNSAVWTFSRGQREEKTRCACVVAWGISKSLFLGYGFENVSLRSWRGCVHGWWI